MESRISRMPLPPIMSANATRSMPLNDTSSDDAETAMRPTHQLIVDQSGNLVSASLCAAYSRLSFSRLCALHHSSSSLTLFPTRVASLLKMSSRVGVSPNEPAFPHPSPAAMLASMSAKVRSLHSKSLTAHSSSGCSRKVHSRIVSSSALRLTCGFFAFFFVFIFVILSFLRFSFRSFSQAFPAQGTPV